MSRRTTPRRLLVAGAALLAVAAAPGQQPTPALLAVEPELQSLLSHRDPVLRGEAALALGQTQQARYYDAIREVATDRERPARLRAILGLGYLAAPGAESFLGNTLERAEDEAERAAAAMALGLLPDGEPVPAVDRFLAMIRGSSYRRHRATLTGLLFGLSQRPHPSRADGLRFLLADSSNRDAALRRLVVNTIVPERSLDEVEVTGWLESREALERLAGIENLQRGSFELTNDTVEAVEALAHRDRHPQVRAAALDLLTRHRLLSGLPIGERALRSDDPTEAAAGVRAARLLGGGKIRATMEQRILEEGSPVLQAAMLAAYEAPASADLVEACLTLATDRRRDEVVRVAAASLCARSMDRRARPALRGLFVEAEHTASLIELAAAMHALDPGLIALDRIYPPASATDERLLPGRMEALLRAGHAGAGTLLQRALRDPRIDRRTLAELVRALRRSASPPVDPSYVELLPRALREIL